MSLDPDDWDSVRAVGHRMIDDMLDYQQQARERGHWRTVPQDTKDRLDETVPHQGQSLEAVYDAFLKDILPYPTGNIHPRFWGWVMGTGTTTGMLAELLTGGMNAHVAGYDQSAALIERQVLNWLKSLMCFPESGSGVLVSGGTAANLNGLLAARQAMAGFDIREEGLYGGPPLTVYGSSETHSWIGKACESMGLGRRAFRKVPVDDAYRIDVEACRALMRADIAEGKRPFAIVGNSGTVNTGAVDDLVALRALADEMGVWFHVDGAFGALVAWTDSRDLVRGQELADSLAFDLHKWGYMPYEVGVILTRDSGAQLATFQPPGGAARPAYLLSASAGASADTTYFADRGLQLSRSFRALKVWMSFKEQGADRIARAIQDNIDQAHHLAALVKADAELELLAPVAMNTVCFRYRRADLDEGALDTLNRAILVQLQMRGIAVPSQTILNGIFAIRVCITNHRSLLSDFDALAEAVVTLGRELAPRST
jgi:glutamate/tyrosine decarboxylase-like PLP-dependent enzyme